MEDDERTTAVLLKRRPTAPFKQIKWSVRSAVASSSHPCALRRQRLVISDLHSPVTIESCPVVTQHWHSLTSVQSTKWFHYSTVMRKLLCELAILPDSVPYEMGAYGFGKL